MKILLTLLLSVAMFFTTKSQTKVYVCKGGYAYAYHQRKNCAGLKNCRATIVEMPENSAITTYKRRKCHKCY